jgi:catechol 2,3-dioxygenase-like lactoylglutathione lyase family enzyme
MSTKQMDTSQDAIDHIAISVRDIKQTVDWYRQRFNCTVKYADDTWAYLEFANIRLALVVAEQHPSHIAFVVEGAEQYGDLKTHRDGTRSVYIEDPAGNSVELLDKMSIKSYSS